MTDYLSTVSKDIQSRIRPHEGFVSDVAARHGVPPAFALAMIRHESAGVPDAIGDAGQGLGWWQVNTKYKDSWGMGKEDARLNPRRSTELIMPSIARIYNKSNGDWGQARVRYMRDPKLAARIAAGEPAEVVLKGQQIALAEYNAFKRIQQRFGDTAAAAKPEPQQTVQPAPPSNAAPMVMPNIGDMQIAQAPEDEPPVDFGYTPQTLGLDTFAGLDQSQAAFLALAQQDEAAQALRDAQAQAFLQNYTVPNQLAQPQEAEGFA